MTACDRSCWLPRAWAEVRRRVGKGVILVYIVRRGKFGLYAVGADCRL